jgi:hypothetical protein
MASEGFRGGVWVTATTVMTVRPSTICRAKTIAQGLVLDADSAPRAASFDQR